MNSAAIATLTELAALDNVDALAEEQITEGKVLVVKDSGNGPGVVIFKLGTLPAETLGVASTGIPGGYWEATGYSTLTAWVESQNFTQQGHIHQASIITGLSEFIADQNISANQIVGLEFPEAELQTVNLKVPVDGNINLTAADINAVDTQTLENTRLEINQQLLDFETDVLAKVDQKSLETQNAVQQDLALLRYDYNDLDNIPNSLISFDQVTLLGPPNDTGYYYKSEVGGIVVVQEIPTEAITGLDIELSNKQPLNIFLSSIAALGELAPASGFIRKTASNSVEISPTIPVATVEGLDAFVDNRITNSTDVDWNNIQNIPASLLSLLAATGTGFLEKTGTDTWAITTPQQTKTNVPGVYGTPTCYTVGNTATEVLPALSEDSFVKITIPYDPTGRENVIHFQDGLNDTTIDPNNHQFGFALQTGIQDYELYCSAGTSIVAIALNSVEQGIIRVAKALLK